MEREIRRRLETDRRRLDGLARALHTVSPLATLDRGYAIVENRDGAIIQDARSVMAGDEIRARLGRGSLTAHVIQVNNEDGSS
jgi:exodeoxyribonuclease VII large subunit